jgi:hypothetical protein
MSWSLSSLLLLILLLHDGDSGLSSSIWFGDRKTPKCSSWIAWYRMDSTHTIGHTSVWASVHDTATRHGTRHPTRNLADVEAERKKEKMTGWCAMDGRHSTFITTTTGGELQSQSIPIGHYHHPPSILHHPSSIIFFFFPHRVNNTAHHHRQTSQAGRIPAQTSQQEQAATNQHRGRASKQAQ